MYALKNKVQLIGRLGNIPDVHITETGRKWARFSLATHEVYRSAQGEKITETQWHNLVAWGKLADMAEKFLNKGCEVVVAGRLINRSYMDKEGNKKYITEIWVSEVLMLGEKRSAKP